MTAVPSTTAGGQPLYFESAILAAVSKLRAILPPLLSANR
jgi:hypothetical protein